MNGESFLVDIQEPLCPRVRAERWEPVMKSLDRSLIRVGTLAEIQQQGVMVVRGEDRPIAVYAHDGRVSAVDNRCPHLGFPLHRGSVRDGILTCHWHH